MANRTDEQTMEAIAALRRLTISRCRDGKIVEEWEVSDVFGLLQQIGALPEMVES